ncbi:MAG: maleylacetoacetate isomerase [Sulfurifustaceae bacterium]
MKLYSYWRSQAAFRVRVALRLKRVEFQVQTIDILKGDQSSPDYRGLNPEMVVPTLIDGDGPPLVQSLAIVEYLDERYPNPPLLPADTRDRAHVRALAQMLAGDAHPFVVPRVQRYLKHELNVDDSGRMKWLRHWMDAGLRAVEATLARDSRTGRFCYRDQPTMADLCLVSHIISATSMPDYDMTPYPTARRIFDACMQIEAFAGAHPLKQPDAPSAAGK